MGNRRIFFVDSNKDYPKIAQNIPSIQPIRNYINDLINECNIGIESIPVLPTSPQMPQCLYANRSPALTCLCHYGTACLCRLSTPLKLKWHCLFVSVVNSVEIKPLPEFIASHTHRHARTHARTHAHTHTHTSHPGGPAAKF